MPRAWSLASSPPSGTRCRGISGQRSLAMSSWWEAEADLEQLLAQVDEAVYEELRGRAGRHRAQQFASHLRRQGFLPTPHFPQRFLQRVLSRGIRFDSRTFRREF